MPCYAPLRGYRSKFPNGSGKFAIVFKPGPSAYDAVEVPCGQCIGCRLSRSREWAVRCVHEASRYDDNCFITLTYRPEDLPADGSLVRDHFVKFMKRLRRRFVEYFGCVIDGVHRFIPVNPIRYYMCGEYGEHFCRPHYHACLFNFEFFDKEVLAKGKDFVLYESMTLDDVWGHGFCSIGEVTFESAAYVSRYCMKKVTGPDRYEHYVNDDGVMLEPEYNTMSRRPGIGRGWYDEFSAEVFPFDEVYIRGAILKPPRYYYEMFKENSPEEAEGVRRKRECFAFEHAADNTRRRLADREVVKCAQVGQLKRSFEVL